MSCEYNLNIGRCVEISLNTCKKMGPSSVEELAVKWWVCLVFGIFAGYVTTFWGILPIFIWRLLLIWIRFGAIKSLWGRSSGTIVGLAGLSWVVLRDYGGWLEFLWGSLLLRRTWDLRVWWMSEKWLIFNRATCPSVLRIAFISNPNVILLLSRAHRCDFNVATPFRAPVPLLIDSSLAQVWV